MTRSILLAGVALLSVSISPLNAEASGAPWCAVSAWGDGDVPWACNYRSFEECYRKGNTLAGNRGFCSPNPSYVANPTELRNSRQASQMGSKTIAKSEKAVAVKKESLRHRATTTTAIKITTVKPKKVAMAAKPTAAKPRNQTEPVEANSRNITEPEVPPSTQPLATPSPVPEKEPTTIGGKTEGPASEHPAEMSNPVPEKERTTIGGKTEGPASDHPAETSGPVPEKEPTTIAGRTEGSASDQLSETSDPVLKKAKITVAAKMEDPASVEFVDIERAVKKIGQSFEIICGHVKGKRNSGEATGERSFLYLVKEDEAFIVGGNPDSMAAIVYRAHCISGANSR